ncbi:EAL domain-containing protein [Paenibacillus athensensis]|uniref:Diguanylate cyclase n=1 Tax=Paenibacillus athensensis TaxID=1967502 RepID=A0A4Y8Q8L8_9BACL|nr:EAL domain-containing protein [Paenibacillus athensensis]MCD1260055.1 EAL domain-containing protein [Paenibacillus athensensis]
MRSVSGNASKHFKAHLWEYLGASGVVLLAVCQLWSVKAGLPGLLAGLVMSIAAASILFVKQAPVFVAVISVLLAAAAVAGLFLEPGTLTLLLLQSGVLLVFTHRIRHLLLARDAYKEVSREMEYMAYHDVLTGLPNRRLFDDRLRQGLIHAKRKGHLAAVLFLDLDRFKEVNDTLGHSSGDALIRHAGERLLHCLREGDTVYRQGGDEFAILLDYINKPEDAHLVALRIQHALETPFQLEGHPVAVTASMGIALYPLDGETPQELMEHADEAMYRAKQRGDNHFQFFAPEINAMVASKLELEEGLRHALERGEMELHYQPQYELSDSRLVGMEAVLRWVRPGRGLMAQHEWVRTAEESGLIAPIGEWALRTACVQAQAWRAMGFPSLKLTMGITAGQFRQEHFLDVVAEALKESGLPPEMLEFDLAEGICALSVQEVRDKLRILKAFGLRIVLDDLSLGLFASPSAEQVPLDTLKLDSNLIRDLPEDRENQALASAIMRMAQRLDLKLVAKGVETKAQLEHLQHLQCQEVQGQLFSNPLAPSAFAELLKQKIS